jgi:O-antigen/teichoic acid export membrane protein
VRLLSAVRDGRRYAAHPVVRSGVVRLITLPITAIAAFGTTAITLHAVGSAAYGYVALVATLATLIPFADLGLGAAIQSATAVAENPPTDRHLEQVLLSSFRLLALSGVVVASCGLLVAETVGWSALLAVPKSGLARTDVLVPIVLGLFAASLPFGIGLRILIGLERNDVAIALASAAPLIALGAVLVLSHTNAPTDAYAVVQPCAMLLTAMASLAVAVRLSGVPVLRVIRHSPRPRAHPGISVAGTAAPMFVIMVGLPVALQSDRVILAHRAGAVVLTEYAVAAQVYASAWSIIYSGGISLWPRFARQHARGHDLRRPWVYALRGFFVAGAVVGGSLAVALPFVVDLLSRGTVRAPSLLAAAFAGLIVVQATHLPSAMLLTSPSLLRFQAACVLAMVAINIPLSWVLAGAIGAAGPVIGSVVAVGAAQLIPGLLKARRFVSIRSNWADTAAPPIAPAPLGG